MPGEWSAVTLREANVALIDCDHRTPPSADVGYPYVAIPQLRVGRIDLSDVRRISHEHYIEWTRKTKPRAKDVVLSRRCNPGETAVAPPDLEFALGRNLFLLRADETRVYPPLLRAQLRVLVKRILRKHGYPPDNQEKATQTVLEQAALLSSEWAAA